MQSLFILGLPRSLTTLVTRKAATALSLESPAWTIDGEILNARYYPFHPEPGTRDHRFTSKACDPVAFDRLGAFLRDLVSPAGHLYKDVVQPFVSAQEATGLGTANLLLRRPLADIAMAMSARGWDYPKAAARNHAGAEAVIEGLLRAADALAQIPAEALDFADLLQDETALEAALMRLYPEARIGSITYLDASFRRRSDQILRARATREYRELERVIAEVADRVAIRIPDGWDTDTPWHQVRHPASESSQPSKPVLLVVGDAVAPTGFARVTSSIISRLTDRFDCHQLGINYGGDPHHHNWPIYPASLGGDPHGVKRVGELVSRLKPAITLLVNDLWIIGDYLEQLSSMRHDSRLIAYIPIDADPLPPALVARLSSLDHIVIYNAYAARALCDSESTLQAAEPSFELPPWTIIPHGIDTSQFRPLYPRVGGPQDQRRAVRRALLPADPSFQDAFIVLNANRNQPRKRIDVTVAGFALFARDKPDNVKLYLHMGATDQGWDIRLLAHRHHIADRIIMSRESSGPPNLTVEELNQVYNACDIGLNTAEAEGWGLASVEHAATGAAQIVPGHSGPKAIWADRAELLEPTLWTTSPGQLTDAQLIAPATVAAKLEGLYQDRGRLEERSAAAYELATDPALSWDTIAAQFCKLMETVVGQGN
jgi:glycosyltransferase involved in cell wall biosynthesis